MLKYADYDIVFQEIPDETTLALNLSLCPNHCAGCHSPQLADDIGEELTESVIDRLLERYGDAITCISLMGGDNDPASIDKIACYIRHCDKKAAWYSGKETLPDGFEPHHFDYVKIGPYIACLGGLKSATTNQHLYKIENGTLIDITNRMHRP